MAYQNTRKKTQNTKLKVGRERKRQAANSTTLTKLVEEGKSEDTTDVPEHMQYLYTNVEDANVEDANVENAS